MISTSEQYNNLLEKARSLVNCVEAGDGDEVNKILDDLGNSREEYLYQELGKLTRELHSTLDNFQSDTRIAQLVGEDIPDARDRLEHVINLTDKSAHRTIDIVEQSIPQCDSIAEEVNKLGQSWKQCKKRKMKLADLKKFYNTFTESHEVIIQDVGHIKSGLNEILMAQDFQDLTGQIISRVITMVADVEESLVNLIKVTGHSQPLNNLAHKKAGDKDKGGIQVEGPQVPGRESESIISGQDGVDDLLSSLGF